MKVGKLSMEFKIYIIVIIIINDNNNPSILIQMTFQSENK